MIEKIGAKTLLHPRLRRWAASYNSIDSKEPRYEAPDETPIVKNLTYTTFEADTSQDRNPQPIEDTKKLRSQSPKPPETVATQPLLWAPLLSGSPTQINKGISMHRLLTQPRLLISLLTITTSASIITAFETVSIHLFPLSRPSWVILQDHAENIQTLPLFVMRTFHWTSTGAGLTFILICLASLLGPMVGESGWQVRCSRSTDCSVPSGRYLPGPAPVHTEQHSDGSSLSCRSTGTDRSLYHHCESVHHGGD